MVFAKEEKFLFCIPLEKGLQIFSILFVIATFIAFTFQTFHVYNLIAYILLAISTLIFIFGTYKKEINSIAQYAYFMIIDTIFNLGKFIGCIIGYNKMIEKMDKMINAAQEDLNKLQNKNGNNNNNNNIKPNNVKAISVADLAEAAGAPPEAVEKARQAEKEAEASGGKVSIADLAESAGAPAHVVEKLRAMEKDNKSDSSSGNSSSSTSSSPKPASTTTIITSSKTTSIDKSTPTSSNLPSNNNSTIINDLKTTNDEQTINDDINDISNLNNTVSLDNTTTSAINTIEIAQDKELIEQLTNEKLRSQNLMKSNFGIYGASTIISLILAIYAYKYYRRVKKVKNTEEV
ncbi:hypothetical protein BCR32DRAFT_277204 [Anaeromyces robustus]|uniref:Uncharacterized protein n=1 Tax=Anaeromyces robustus TaxID=1754192 RepID=A0A1Y1XF10_9FUNG|nr:hypothetical protein BCR32DRAFT_277204 [Anaeromyces robustus]|eukprot:ORX84313.1 hypothetical protein BCR32DRAFT_277204 [Anaeromyces robustus]